MTYFLLFVAAFLIGAAFWWFTRSRANQSTTAGQSESSGPQTDPSKKFADAIDQLVTLNRTTRLNPDLSDSQVAAVENVIDVGLRVVGAASEKFAGHPASFEICRIVGHWLPDHVNRFAAMSEAARQAGTEEFFSALQTLRKELEEAERFIQQGDEIKYAANLTMIELKYGKA